MEDGTIVVWQSTKTQVGDSPVARETGVFLPSDTFADEEQIRKWAIASYRFYQKLLAEHLLRECQYFKTDATSFGLGADGFEKQNVRAIAESHAGETAIFLKKLFGLYDTGQRSEWTKKEMTRAVTQALRGIEPAKRTYSAVANILKRTHSDKAPPSGDALRKLIGRFEINWKELKRKEVKRTQVLLNSVRLSDRK